MAISRGPNIVRNGLVLALDAANLRSYPGTGTTWADLSGNGYDATMYGSVPFSVDGVSCFDFSTVTGTFPSNATLGFTFTSNISLYYLKNIIIQDCYYFYCLKKY